MILTGLRPLLIDVPPHDAPPYSSWKAEAGRHIFVRLDTDVGLVGWGSCFAYRQPQVVYAAVETLARELVGQDIPAPAETAGRLEQLVRFDHPHERYAASGVEVGIWDLHAKARGQPVYALLGMASAAARRRAVPAYASLPRYDSPADVARAAAMAAERGFAAIKLHQRDVRSVRAAREAIGDQRALMLDVNGAWTVDEAVEHCREMEDLGLAWVEEPISPLDDHAGLARLRARVSIPIATGENEWEPAAYRGLIDAGSADVLQPSVLKVGGLQRLLEISRIIDGSSATMVPHAYYFGPGLAASLHVAAVSKHEFPLEIPFADFVDGITLGPCRIDGGHLTVPDTPGLGADPDSALIERFSIH